MRAIIRAKSIDGQNRWKLFAGFVSRTRGSAALARDYRRAPFLTRVSSWNSRNLGWISRGNTAAPSVQWPCTFAANPSVIGAFESPLVARFEEPEVFSNRADVHTGITECKAQGLGVVRG